MTLPPQGPYGSQPSEGGGPQWGGPPQGPGAQQPYGGGPAGHPQGGPQYGQPGAPWPQQPWVGGPPQPSNNGGGKGKWILIGLALVAVIAVSVVGTVLVLRPDSGGGNGQSNTANGASEFASANDTGPVNIVTEDPTCEAWTKISHEMDAAVPGWNKQDYSVPAAEWSQEQREVFNKQAEVLASVIPKVANLAKKTPHRVMRELYGQFNAYAQAVIDSIPTYSTADNELVAASNKFTGALIRVCDAIYFHAAQQTAPLVDVPAPPSEVNRPEGDGKQVPVRFLSDNSHQCGDWIPMVARFNDNTTAWRGTDSKLSVAEWTSEQRAIMDAVGPVMTIYADDMERLGRGSSNPIWEDFAVFAAQYMRAYVQAIPTYNSNVSYMVSQATSVANAINWACKAAS
ncbi:hypothetical protein A5733_00885 [Mycobacterium sp. NS-7484]|uniref:hypothetical protein n=1 Tax=Mycobacterium sp. NS-7484 TaxID=1834161 RepID=UPI00096D075D|nr:hypothetical protein [Mycobacterium sp. NS-7484]OMB99259.1 hypothetical protein A5733_00885 [Mycobacterium sp. NS-7484]